MKESLKERISAARRFNRGFARRIGLFQEGLLESSFSLTEARILFEIGTNTDFTASHLCREMGLDGGHLSRILAKFEKSGLLKKTPSETDARQRFLRLTQKGKEAFDLINSRADADIARLLDPLSEEEQKRVLKAMEVIENLLLKDEKNSSSSRQSYILRQHEPGDMGWIIYRHGVIYAQEYGWNEEFEALVAQICADFLNNYNPKRERCWIAEMDGEIIGSVFLSQGDEADTARLRVLLVEPRARGMGVGKRLVEECIKFARRAGYRRITLWTYSALSAAGRIYEKTGFQIVSEEKRNDFGQEGLTGQVWELEL
jgi:DNA-binding MarR family transcriptional regulator/GNAT superfamily N-acetyltransferase